MHAQRLLLQNEGGDGDDKFGGEPKLRRVKLHSFRGPFAFSTAKSIFTVKSP